MKIETSVPQKLSPGYIFITPYEAQNPGPYIYDNEGVCHTGRPTDWLTD